MSGCGSFMLGYFLTSPAFGVLGDRRPREALIAGGVLVWSLATAASGLAVGFASLLAARIVVGVGEACDATLSPTIIDDLTDPEFKSRALAVFYAACPSALPWDT
jgi:MFS family permease